MGGAALHLDLFEQPEEKGGVIGSVQKTLLALAGVDPLRSEGVQLIERWKSRARALRVEVMALWLAYRDPRVPWYAKLVAACVVAYALSPIDLIPDPIPILGYVDDLVLVPLGILMARRLIPGPVLAECRERAAGMTVRPKSLMAAGVIVALWVIVAAGILGWVARRLGWLT